MGATADAMSTLRNRLKKQDSEVLVTTRSCRTDARSRDLQESSPRKDVL